MLKSYLDIVYVTLDSWNTIAISFSVSKTDMWIEIVFMSVQQYNSWHLTFKL